MIIYKFSNWFTNGELFTVKELEVEEKPKIYVGNGFRVRKDEIDVLSKSFGENMYCLDSDPKNYVRAVIEKRKKRIAALERDLSSERKRLEGWEKEAGRMGLLNEV